MFVEPCAGCAASLKVTYPTSKQSHTHIESSLSPSSGFCSRSPLQQSHLQSIQQLNKSKANPDHGQCFSCWSVACSYFPPPSPRSLLTKSCRFPLWVLAHIFWLRFAGRDEHIIYFGQDVLVMCCVRLYCVWLCCCAPVCVWLGVCDCLCVCVFLFFCVCLIAGCQRLRDKLTARNMRATPPSAAASALLLFSHTPARHCPAPASLRHAATGLTNVQIMSQWHSECWRKYGEARSSSSNKT